MTQLWWARYPMLIALAALVVWYLWGVLQRDREDRWL